MTCPNCGHPNEAGRKFCAECGTALAVVCPSCGTANAPGVKFCGECGTAIAAQPAPARPAAVPAPATAERRQVTVLFIDLAGFTQFAERRDAEDVRDIQTRYFALARDTIGRYGGTVEKFIGDAVMAVWGAPVAYEDDAERAVRAALDVVGAVATVDPALSARAGVVTGETAVSVGATGEALVTGDAVNTASRLQSAAAPGTVLVSEATRAATRDAIVFERAEDQQLKGKELPIPAWRALRVIGSRRGARRSGQLEPPFVGREQELRPLKELLNTSAAVRRTRLVSIVGQAGVGKSRLAWELEKYVDGIVETVYWHYGRSPSHGEGVAFWALGEIVRQRALIAEHDDPDTSRAKLAATVSDFIPDEKERTWVEPRLQALLGLADSVPTGDQEELFAAWRRFFERIAERGTTVLVFEDLQWADAGLVEFISSLVEWSRRSPLLILTLARPEVFARHPGWGAGQLNFFSIHVEPLSAAEMTELLTGLAPGLPPKVLNAIVERAEGIPLYAVEMVRMLIDSGDVVRDEETGTFRAAAKDIQPRVPESLHALVAARLDALSPVERELVQDASVIGQSFSVRSLLAFVEREPADTERLLLALVRRELLTRIDDPTSPERGQFAFVQSVVREVAYETMSRATRRAKHAAAARDLEATGDDELAPLLASHYYRAYQLASGPEADALASQARIALRAAGERAAALHSHDQAITFFEQALALTADPAERAGVLDALGDVAFSGARLDDSADYYRRAFEAFDAAGDRHAAIRAQAKSCGVVLFSGRPLEVIETLQSLLAEAAARGDESTSAQVGAQVGRGMMMLNRNEEALPIIEQALIHSSNVDDAATTVEALVTKGGILSNIGRWREAVAVLAGAVELSALWGMPQARFRGTYNLHGSLSAEDPKGADQFLRAGYAAAVEFGQRQWIVALGKLVVGDDLAEGRWDDAMELAEELQSSAMSTMDAAIIEGTVASVLAARGDDDGATRKMMDGWRHIEGVTKFDDLGWMHFSQASVHEAAGRYSEATDTIMEAVTAGIFPLVNAAVAACYRLLLRDDRQLDDLAKLLHETPESHERFIQSLITRGDAAIAAMRGDTGRAQILFRRVADEQREMGQLSELAFTDRLIVSTFGAKSAIGKAAEQESRRLLEQVGAHALLARLDDAVRQAPLAAEAGTAPSVMGQVVEPVL